MILRRNDLEFQSVEEVGQWYDHKFSMMGGCWVTPPRDLEMHLRALVGKSPGSGKRLLDLGCGDGQFILYAATSREFSNCVGVDVSSVALEFARQRTSPELADRIKWMNYPMEHMDRYAAGVFDYVVSLGSMEHSLNIPAACRAMADCLHPQGRYMIFVPNEDYAHRDQPLETIMMASEWEALLDEAGLYVDLVQRVNDSNQIGGGRYAR